MIDRVLPWASFALAVVAWHVLAWMTWAHVDLAKQQAAFICCMFWTITSIVLGMRRAAS